MATEIDDILVGDGEGFAEYEAFVTWPGCGESRRFVANLANVDTAHMNEEARRGLVAEAVVTELGGRMFLDNLAEVGVEVRRVGESQLHLVRVQKVITTDYRCI